MALTRALRYRTRDRGQNAYRVANGVTIYVGALVGVNPDGFLVNWSELDGIRFKGVMQLTTDQRRFDDTKLNSVVGDTSVAAPPEAPVNESGMVLERVVVGGTLAQADVGGPLFATDENTLTKTAAMGVNSIGTIIRVHSATTADVQPHTPHEYEAMQRDRVGN